MTDSDRSDIPEWPKIGIDTDVDGDITVESISTDTFHLPEDPDAYGEIVGAVPIGVLEDLVEDCDEIKENMAFKHENYPTGDYTEGGIDTLERCINELQEVINDYE